MPKKIKTKLAKVVGISGDKTIKVEYSYFRAHPIYRKILEYKTRILVHDPKNIYRVNDKVSIRASRRFSSRKAHIVIYPKTT